MTKQGCYQVKVGCRARGVLEKLPRKLLSRILPAMQQLAIDPRPKGCKKLSSQGSVYRMRVGAYRVVYQVQDDELLVLVVRVTHRRDAYRNL